LSWGSTWRRVPARSNWAYIAASEWGMIEMTQEIFEKLIEKTLINPTFVTRLPVELVPLAKACADDAQARWMCSS
jgi:lysyl-tRNA synthetase class II